MLASSRGEDVILPSFSLHVLVERAKEFAADLALALAPALYRNHVGWDSDSLAHVNPLRSMPQPQPQYPNRREAKASVCDILTQLEYQGVIESCTSPMNNPLFMVSKPAGSYCLVLDYRNLNSHCRTFAVQNTHSSALLNNLVPIKYKTTLDISNGFYSNNLAPESLDLTAFTAVGTQKKFTRLPLGYKNSPRAFAARIVSLSHDIDPDALSYVDDLYLTDDELMRILKESTGLS